MGVVVAVTRWTWWGGKGVKWDGREGVVKGQLQPPLRAYYMKTLLSICMDFPIIQTSFHVANRYLAPRLS